MKGRQRARCRPRQRVLAPDDDEPIPAFDISRDGATLLRAQADEASGDDPGD